MPLPPDVDAALRELRDSPIPGEEPRSIRLRLEAAMCGARALDATWLPGLDCGAWCPRLLCDVETDLHRSIVDRFPDGTRADVLQLDYIADAVNETLARKYPGLAVGSVIALLSVLLLKIDLDRWRRDGVSPI